MASFAHARLVKNIEENNRKQNQVDYAKLGILKAHTPIKLFYRYNQVYKIITVETQTTQKHYGAIPLTQL